MIRRLLAAGLAFLVLSGACDGHPVRPAPPAPAMTRP